MKNKKLALVATMIASITALSFAQKVEFHGLTDYSSYVGGYATKDGDADWQKSDIYATLGDWDGGMTQVDMKVTANNFQFNFGIRLGSDLTAYTDSSGNAIYGDYVPFYQGNMRITFLDGLVKAFVGKFEDESFGYHTSGFAWGAYYGNDFASSDSSQYLTAVELKPAEYVDGLTVFAGVPVVADCFNNGITSLENNDKLDLLARQARAGVRYEAPFGAIFMVGYQNAVWDVGNDVDTYTDYYESTTKFREGWVNVDIADLIGTGIALRGGYDFQQRLADLGAIKHNAFVSASYKPIEGLETALDLRAALAMGNFESEAKNILFYQVNAKVAYDLAEDLVVGFLGNVSYMSDSSGLVGTGEISGDSGDLGFSINNYSLALPDAVTAGLSGTGLGICANPYIQSNFSNGYVSAGVLVQMNQYTSETTNYALSYAVPLKVVFKF